MFRDALPAEWVSREQTSDYGIDLEIETADRVVSGRLCKVQVKGHEQIPWSVDGTYWQPLDAEKAAYLGRLPLPTIVGVVDVGSKTAFWAPADTIITSDRGRIGVRVSRASRLPETSGKLLDFIREWLAREATQMLLNEFPRMDEALQRCAEEIDKDCFLGVERESEALLRYAYSGIFRVARTLAINERGPIPWELWLARSKHFWGDGEPLSWGTFDEIVAYLTPVRDAVKLALKAKARTWEPTPENAPLLEYLDDYGVRFVFHTGFEAIKSYEFWHGVDEMLRSHGALKFWVKKPDDKA